MNQKILKHKIPYTAQFMRGIIFVLMMLPMMLISKYSMATAVHTSTLAATFDSSNIGCTFGNAWSKYGASSWVLDGAGGNNTTISGNPGGGCSVAFSVLPGTLMFNDGYPPSDGDYVVEMRYGTSSGNSSPMDKTSTYDHMTKSKAWTIQVVNGEVTSLKTTSMSIPASVSYTYCYALASSNFVYKIDGPTGCLSGTPVPPAPPPITCKFADGNALNVDMGQIDRTSLPVTPNTGTKVSKPINVSCEGEDTLTTEMSVSYTSITVNGTEVDKTSSNGVGVTILLDGQPVGNNAKASKSFTPGTNTLDFAFEAVRDPAVPVAEIATGAFTANAIVTITPQ